MDEDGRHKKSSKEITEILYDDIRNFMIANGGDKDPDDNSINLLSVYLIDFLETVITRAY